MNDDIFIGTCLKCRRKNTELDIDTGECVNCVKQYVLEQDKFEKRSQNLLKDKLM